MRTLLFALLSLVGLLFLPVVSATLVGLGVHFLGLGEVLGTVGWLLIAPVLYVFWMLGFLSLSALLMTWVGWRYPKPRHLTTAGDRRTRLRFIAVAIHYFRAAQIRSLPLLPHTPPLRNLVLRAYASSTHLGRRVTILGQVYDPDLTWIDDHAIVGGRASVVAHDFASRPDGTSVYVSSPIRIGKRAAIGGEARVGMGVTVGDDAVVEPGGVVRPFTTIPAGEVWGGNPAVFRRRRTDASPSVPTPDATPRATPADREKVRRLVADALGVAVDTLGPDAGATTVAVWDSLGQVSIAAALYDHYGITPGPDDVFALRTLDDVAALVAGPRTGRDTDTTPIELPVNPEILPLLDPVTATRALTRRHMEPAPGAPLRIVVAATFTAEPLAQALRVWARAFDIETECVFHAFDQVEQALLDPQSPFGTNRGGLNVVLVRPEDLVRADGPEARERAEAILETAEAYAERGESGRLVVSTLPPAVSALETMDRVALDTLRSDWQRRLAENDDVEILDLAAVVEEVGTAAASDAGFETAARAPFTPRVYQEIGIHLARIVRRRRRPAAKVLALDCDGTLWGGVVGEDGLDGLALGDDGPGRGYRALQRFAREQKEAGVLLALASRNEEADVWEVFDTHPGMLLRRDDVAAWRIDWEPKSAGLVGLAREMNLGLDAFVFVDDDAAVCLEVETNAPGVTVVKLPGNPAHFHRHLSRLWVFDADALTGEDMARTRMMQQERLRAVQRETTPNLEAYLESLEIEVDLHPADPAELPRVAQLMQRTNQFNLSLRRRTLEEVKLLGPDAVFVVRARDRFGDYGLVGVCIVDDDDDVDAAVLDTFLLSCRALGRGVEEAFLQGIAETMLARGKRRLHAPYVEGPRNRPVLDFLRSQGFVESEESEPGVLACDIEAGVLRPSP